MEPQEIEQALHDGVQQDLVAVAVRLQLLRQLVETDPRATELLDEISRDVHDAIERVREVAGRIYPAR